MHPLEITLTNEPVPATVYQHLRTAAGLSPKSDEAIARGLPHTLHWVGVRNTAGTYIGMGRVIGDGGTACQVTDICVLPTWQGQGVGHQIMQDIRQFIDQQLPVGCYISLLADGPAQHLYARYGFQDTLPASRGMFLMRR